VADPKTIIYVARHDSFFFCLKHSDRNLLVDAIALAARVSWSTRSEDASFNAFRVGVYNANVGGQSEHPAIEFALAPVRADLEYIPDGFTALPGRIGAKTVAELVGSWLNQGEYPREPSHDGSNSQGFEVATTTLGIAVIKRWVEFHK
jgi:hypothetical protein